MTKITVDLPFEIGQEVWVVNARGIVQRPCPSCKGAWEKEVDGVSFQCKTCTGSIRPGYLSRFNPEPEKATMVGFTYRADKPVEMILMDAYVILPNRFDVFATEQECQEFINKEFKDEGEW